MPIPDWFGFPDPSTPKQLSAPTGFSDVHQDGMSWAKEGPTVDETTWIKAESWNRVIANLRGLLALSGVDVSDLAVNSNLLLRTFIIRAINAILDGTDIEGAGVLMKSVYDPAATGKVALGAGGTGVAATDLADLRAKIGVTAAITALSDSVTSALAAKLALDGSNFADDAAKATFRAATGLAYADLPWLAVPVGGVVALPTHLTGCAIPGTGSALYRFAQLTAGLTGAAAYNENVLGAESVSGSAPLVQATANVTLTGSPMIGQTIRLLNTEGRFVRPGTSSGTVRADQFQDHQHESLKTLDGSVLSSTNTIYDLMSQSGTTNPDVVTGLVIGSTRRGNETYPKHIDMTYYMRVK